MVGSRRAQSSDIRRYFPLCGFLQQVCAVGGVAADVFETALADEIGDDRSP